MPKHGIYKDELYPYFGLDDDRDFEIDPVFEERLKKANEEFFACQAILKELYNKER